MAKNKKRRRPAAKTCDPNLCDHCMYIGDGDFVCVTSTAWGRRKPSLCWRIGSPRRTTCNAAGEVLRDDP